MVLRVPDRVPPIQKLANDFGELNVYRWQHQNDDHGFLR